MAISAFSLFKIDFGPPSSHAIGPFWAVWMSALSLEQARPLRWVAQVKSELFGSLGAIGKGHSSDMADRFLLKLRAEPRCSHLIASCTQKFERILLLQQKQLSVVSHMLAKSWDDVLHESYRLLTRMRARRGHCVCDPCNPLSPSRPIAMRADFLPSPDGLFYNPRLAMSSIALLLHESTSPTAMVNCGTQSTMNANPAGCDSERTQMRNSNICGKSRNGRGIGLHMRLHLISDHMLMLCFYGKDRLIG